MANEVTGDSLDLLFEMLEEEELMEAMFDAETDDIIAQVILTTIAHKYITTGIFRTFSIMN